MIRINIRYTGTNEDGFIYENENKTFTLHYPCSSTSACSPYEVTLSAGVYNIECWGASGFNQSNGFSLGGFTSGVLYLSHPKTFFVYIGSTGTLGPFLSFNGGGKGSVNGFSGGGATDIRLTDGHYFNFNSLLSRIMVAGGGGGHNVWASDAYIEYYGEKNNAIGLHGGRGMIKRTLPGAHDIPHAMGGSQTDGGVGGYCVSPCGHDNKTIEADGKFGIGGNATNPTYSSGGGGGYFGGGSGHVDNYIVSGGGGGSSYISGYNGCKSVSHDSTIDQLISTSSSIHFSGYQFFTSYPISFLLFFIFSVSFVNNIILELQSLIRS